ncbi:hypothetical protein KC323_g327 [Hortaea werneckii]|nr:hypothetical protein KC323_g327 [Hortaea werneckii]KAI7360149.1 hypothetical protein KC320_g279 [Hortaea werneckii]
MIQSLVRGSHVSEDTTRPGHTDSPEGNPTATRFFPTPKRQGQTQDGLARKGLKERIQKAECRGGAKSNARAEDGSLQDRYRRIASLSRRLLLSHCFTSGDGDGELVHGDPRRTGCDDIRAMHFMQTMTKRGKATLMRQRKYRSQFETGFRDSPLHPWLAWVLRFPHLQHNNHPDFRSLNWASALERSSEAAPGVVPENIAGSLIRSMCRDFFIASRLSQGQRTDDPIVSGVRSRRDRKSPRQSAQSSNIAKSVLRQLERHIHDTGTIACMCRRGSPDDSNQSRLRFEMPLPAELQCTGLEDRNRYIMVLNLLMHATLPGPSKPAIMLPVICIFSVTSLVLTVKLACAFNARDPFAAKELCTLVRTTSSLRHLPPPESRMSQFGLLKW